MRTNRQILSILFLILGTITCAHASGGLIGFYPLDGNANDLSGNGRHGTIVGGVSFGNDSSRPAALFNGVDAYIALPNSISNYQDLAITFWIKTGAANSNTFPNGMFVISRDAPSDTYDWNVCLQQGRKMMFQNNGNELVTANDIASNQWVHIACVVDSALQTKRVFINGQQAASASLAVQSFGNNDTPIFLGAATIATGSHIYFEGEMAGVRFYGRPLTANEVQQLYQSELNGACPPHSATALPQLVNGFVVGATITDGGCGYTNAPTVLIKGGGGSGAVATATVSGGQVTAINITDAGCCYTNAPTIVIGSPPFLPTLDMAVSRVNVTQHVVLGGNYLLESSSDLENWTATGPPFTADSEVIVTEFIINQAGQYFRIRQVP